MNNIYAILDTINSGYFPITLDIFSLSSIISAVVVITIKNPIHSILSLIMLFFFISCYLISIGVDFMGIAYLLIYVGAISILFLFILMLINIRVSELVSATKNSIPLIFSVIFIFQYANTNTNNLTRYVYSYFSTLFNNEGIIWVTSSNWEDVLILLNHIASIGNVIYSIYAILIILVSIILLLAMIGAITITIKQKLSQDQLIYIKL